MLIKDSLYWKAHVDLSYALVTLDTQTTPPTSHYHRSLLALSVTLSKSNPNPSSFNGSIIYLPHHSLYISLILNASWSHLFKPPCMKLASRYLCRFSLISWFYLIFKVHFLIFFSNHLLHAFFSFNRVWIANFFFISCNQYCMLLVDSMSTVFKGLKLPPKPAPVERKLI